MRNFLIAAILIVLIAIALVASPFFDVSQTAPGSLPDVEANQDGITAKGGKAPSFEVETGSVKMGDDSIEIQTAEGANAPDDDAAADGGSAPSATP